MHGELELEPMNRNTTFADMIDAELREEGAFFTTRMFAYKGKEHEVAFAHLSTMTADGRAFAVALSVESTLILGVLFVDSAGRPTRFQPTPPRG